MSTLIFMSKREQNKIDKLGRIREAARTLFVEKGYADTTTRDIATEAGIATGTLFVYFKEKRDLLMDVYQGWVDDALDEGFASFPDRASATDTLLHMFERIYAVHERHPDLARVWVKELHFVEGEAYAKSAAWTMRFLQRFSDRIRALQKHGALRADLQPMSAAMHVFALYYFALVSWLGSHGAVGPAMRDQLFRQWVEDAVRGFQVTVDPETKEPS